MLKFVIAIAILLLTLTVHAETISLSMGGGLACAVHNGQVRCWGTTSNGGLGSPGTDETNVPRVVTSITTATDVAVGQTHGCALLVGGAMQCWGNGQSGQLGNGANPVAQISPVSVTGLAGPVLAIAATNFSTCALIQGGAVQCFGSDFRGQLGNDTLVNNTNVPGNVIGLSNATKLTAGATHFCAVLVDGSARCWGDNSSGQLGNNSFTDQQTAVAVNSLAGAQQISAGEFHTCAATSTGLKCWGNNLFGQLGDSTTTASLIPINSIAIGAANITRLTSGGRHNCAQLSTGVVLCWGRNFDGQLGQASNSIFSFVGVSMQGLASTPIAIVGGNATTCMRLSVDDIRCVGSGTFGQLGDALVRRFKAPVNAIFSSTSQLAMGSQHTCARTNSTLQCLGFNGAGALGDGTTERRLTLTNVVGSSGSGSTLVASETQTCNFVASSTNSQCFGRNDFAQLGTAATSTQETSAINAPSLGANRQLLQIELGTFFGCALLSENDGAGPIKKVRCWGRNDKGQLGDGSIINGFAPSASVLINLVDPIAIGVGELHGCALEASGTIKCWGSNDSAQLGRGVGGVVPSLPAAVTGITTATQIIVAKDGRHSCAILNDNTAKCWGANRFGQLGDNAPNQVGVSTPVAVSGLTGIQKMIAGGTHTCALLSTQGVKCWGSNFLDQLGAPGLQGNPTPIDVSTLTSGVLELTGGSQHSCARLDSGWKCWGYNGHGELGNGKAGVALLPVRVVEPGTLFLDGFE